MAPFARTLTVATVCRGLATNIPLLVVIGYMVVGEKRTWASLFAYPYNLCLLAPPKVHSAPLYVLKTIPLLAINGPALTQFPMLAQA